MPEIRDYEFVVSPELALARKQVTVANPSRADLVDRFFSFADLFDGEGMSPDARTWASSKLKTAANSKFGHGISGVSGEINVIRDNWSIVSNPRNAVVVAAARIARVEPRIAMFFSQEKGDKVSIKDAVKLIAARRLLESAFGTYDDTEKRYADQTEFWRQQYLEQLERGSVVLYDGPAPSSVSL